MLAVHSPSLGALVDPLVSPSEHLGARRVQLLVCYFLHVGCPLCKNEYIVSDVHPGEKILIWSLKKSKIFHKVYDYQN